MKWKSVETAPEDKWILFWCHANKPFAGSFTTLGIRKKDSIWDGRDHQPVTQFTHWMPLPKPPTARGSHVASAILAAIAIIQAGCRWLMW
jgi:hypothetical protein